MVRFCVKGDCLNNVGCANKPGVTLSHLCYLLSAGQCEPLQLCEDRGLFPCANGACVPEIKINNSVNDCGDNSDEGMLDQYC